MSHVTLTVELLNPLRVYDRPDRATAYRYHVSAGVQVTVEYDLGDLLCKVHVDHNWADVQTIFYTRPEYVFYATTVDMVKLARQAVAAKDGDTIAVSTLPKRKPEADDAMFTQIFKTDELEQLDVIASLYEVS